MGIYRAERDAPRFAWSGREFVAREVDCWASGGRICRFAVRTPTAELDAQ